MSGNDARYKYYRNEISKLTRISKKLYYHEFFNNNLNNLKKTREGIKVIPQYCTAHPVLRIITRNKL